MNSTIFLKTKGGLCNRLRAIDSAIILSKKIDKKLIVIWENNNDLGANFKDLFEDIKNVKIVAQCPKKLSFFLKKKTWLKHLNSTLVLNTEITTLNIKLLFKSTTFLSELKTYRYIYFETEHAFLYPENFKMFKPLKVIQKIVNKNESLIGLHIRRTDHDFAKLNSPTELFIKTIKKELEQNPTTKFYLATDDLEIKSILMRMFKNKIITNNFELSRLSLNGAQNAVVDLFSLASCIKIYGSLGSSFSETAYHIGDNELILLK